MNEATMQSQTELEEAMHDFLICKTHLDRLAGITLNPEQEVEMLQLVAAQFKTGWQLYTQRRLRQNIPVDDIDNLRVVWENMVSKAAFAGIRDAFLAFDVEREDT